MPYMIDDHVDGYLIDTSSGYWQEDLYKVLSDLLDHPEKARAMGEAGSRKVSSLYSAERVGAMYKSFFDGLGPPFDEAC